MDSNRARERSDPPKVRFRRLRPEDKQPLVAIASQIWEGHDYLPHVFDTWVQDREAYFVGMLLEGQLVGCGRLMAFDRRRGWLESLRVDPDLQGRGLGREMARHLLQTARQTGFEELIFSTYFGNTSSIKIAERAGFQRIATYTNLEVELEKLESPPNLAHCRQEVMVSPGIPATPGFMWNDWLCVPPDVRSRQSYFPNPSAVTAGDACLVLADNTKYPARVLDICWVGALVGSGRRACLRYAIAQAYHLGRRLLHVMVPAGIPIEPFTSLGFFYYEQKQDVYVYSGKMDRLTL